MVHFLRYIRENKTLGLNNYADMNDAPVSDLFIQASIKTENQLMNFSASSWKGFPETGRSTVVYIIFIKMRQLTMSHMFQYQFLNQVQKLSTMNHELQEWLLCLHER